MDGVRRAIGLMRDRFRQAAIVSFLVLVVSPAIVYAAEHRHQPALDHPGDAYLWLGRVLIEGSTPFRMTTPVGFVGFYIARLAGYGLVAFATGAITSQIVKVVIFRGAGLGSYKQSGHLVICGWNSQGREIVRELGSHQVGDDREIVILAQLSTDPYPENPRVTFIKGNPTSTDDLVRAGVVRASGAIVVADATCTSSDPDDMDARTLITVLAIESLNPHCYTCVEVIKPENRPHFDRAKADELVVSAEMTGALLASSAKTHGLSRIVANLLTHPEDMEFYRHDVPDSMVGLTVQEVVALVKARHDALLVGMFDTTGAPIVNPPGQRVLLAGEALLVVADGPPSLGSRTVPA